MGEPSGFFQETLNQGSRENRKEEGQVVRDTCEGGLAFPQGTLPALQLPGPNYEHYTSPGLGMEPRGMGWVWPELSKAQLGSPGQAGTSISTRFFPPASLAFPCVERLFNDVTALGPSS